MIIALYPGTFDPITKGHLDIIKRSVKFVEKLIIAVSENNEKKTLFTSNERVEMIKKVLIAENIKNVEVTSFKGLLMNFAKKNNASIVIRGLRAVSDFEYEFQMTGMNYKLDSEIETIFLMSSDKYQLISSKLIKEINSLKGDVSQFVPKVVEEELKKKINKYSSIVFQLDCNNIFCGRLAQLVEQWTFNPRVGGSIPPAPTF